MHILKLNKIPSQLLANPQFLNGLDYEQDKMTPLHDVFANSSLVESKILVDKFIEFNKTLLALGVIDRYFNIAKNFCLNAKDEIVLTDIGEIMDDPNLILEQRRKRIWAVDYIAGCIENVELQKYFVEQMDKHFGISESEKDNPRQLS